MRMFLSNYIGTERYMRQNCSILSRIRITWGSSDRVLQSPQTRTGQRYEVLCCSCNHRKIDPHLRPLVFYIKFESLMEAAAEQKVFGNVVSSFVTRLHIMPFEILSWLTQLSLLRCHITTIMTCGNFASIRFAPERVAEYRPSLYGRPMVQEELS